MMGKGAKLLSGLFNSQEVYAWSVTKKNGESWDLLPLLLLLGMLRGDGERSDDVCICTVSLTLLTVNPHRAQSKTSNLTGGVVPLCPMLCNAGDGLRGRIWLEMDTTPARAKAPQRIIMVCIMAPVH